MAFEFNTQQSAIEFIKKKFGYKRLPKGMRQEIIDGVKRHQKRWKRAVWIRANSYEYGIAKHIKHLREKRHLDVLNRLCHLYRHSQSSWAGGDSSVNIEYDDKPSAVGYSTKQWSDNGKWSGSNTHFEITLQPSWHKSVPNHIKQVGGLLTTHAKQLSDDCWEIDYITQGRGFDLNINHGFIVDIDGHWYHGRTEASARQAAAKKARERKLIDELKGISIPDFVLMYGHLEVKRSDSLKINCEAGTDSWIERYAPGKEKLTVKEVLSLDPSDRVLQVCKVAVLRFYRSRKQELATA